MYTLSDSALSRFWSYVDKTPGLGQDGQCWLWTGENNGTYGRLWVADGSRRGKRIFAHRLSYDLHYKDLKEGMFVCHSCNTPLCCHPMHLWQGTAKDNSQDASRKGRSSFYFIDNKGSNHAQAKLTEDDVYRIRELCREYSANQISKMYNISNRHVLSIIRGTAWSCLGLEDLSDVMVKEIGKGIPQPFSRGSKSGRAKLDEEKVMVIKQMITNKSMQYKDIAAMYGVTPPVISAIARGLTWTHVQLPNA